MTYTNGARSPDTGRWCANAGRRKEVGINMRGMMVHCTTRKGGGLKNGAHRYRWLSIIIAPYAREYYPAIHAILLRHLHDIIAPYPAAGVLCPSLRPISSPRSFYNIGWLIGWVDYTYMGKNFRNNQKKDIREGRIASGVGSGVSMT